MHLSFLTLCAFSASLVSAAKCYDESSFKPEDIIERDVLVLGGGATGTFAAVKLRDAGKSVVVVEKSYKLGGHVDTYRDPKTNAPIDYGVVAWIKNKQTVEFTSRFDVALNSSAVSPFPSKVVDFKTGQLIPGVSAPNPASLAGPLAGYLAAASQYSYLAEGFYDLPDPIPEDLLMPFGQWVQKYNLTETLQVVWIFANSIANMLDQPALYILQHFGQSHILGLAAGYEYAIEGNQVLYDRAAAFLGSDVLFHSTIVQSTRTDDGVTAVVASQDGSRKLVKAKKLLITIAPTVDNLSPMDLDDNEKSIFSEWQQIPYWIGVISKSGLEDQTNFLNVDPTQPDAFPRIPFVWRLETPGLPGYLTVKITGADGDEANKDLVREAVKNCGKGTGAAQATGDVEFSAWTQHTEHFLHVSNDALKAGHYRKMYALQGQRSTYWTGGAWATDYSPQLWAYTEERVLPGLIKA